MPEMFKANTGSLSEVMMNPPFSSAAGIEVLMVCGVMKMYPGASSPPLPVMVRFGGVCGEDLNTRHGHMTPLGSVSTCTYAALGILGTDGADSAKSGDNVFAKKQV